MTTAAALSELWSEKQVYDMFGHLFAERELRIARKRGEIAWFDLRKGPHYTPAQLWDYLLLREKKACPANAPLVEEEPDNEAPAKRSGYSKSANFGSERRKAPTPSINTGMTPELEERAARVLDCTP